LEDVNLRVMETLRRAFGLSVGYSDHTEGIAVPIAAAAMGAEVIEKHFTLDRGLPGPDHKASLEIKELESMIKAIRMVETALGLSVKRPSAAELKNRDIARKSIVALKEIRAGEVFSEINLTVKRPGTGISPMDWDKIIGRAATKHYSPDEAIEW
jgi:N,N'-diacetyllegionaminate synthase